jgi:hypothetical protein
VAEGVDPWAAVDEEQGRHNLLERQSLEGRPVEEVTLVSLDDPVARHVGHRVEKDEQPVARPAVRICLQHGEREQMVEPDLLEGRSAQLREGGVGEDARRAGDLVDLFTVVSRADLQALVVLDLDADESLAAIGSGVFEVDVERGAVAEVGLVAASGGVLELDARDPIDACGPEVAAQRRRTAEIGLQFPEEVEAERLARQQVVVFRGFEKSLPSSRVPVESSSSRTTCLMVSVR